MISQITPNIFLGAYEDINRIEKAKKVTENYHITDVINCLCGDKIEAVPDNNLKQIFWHSREIDARMHSDPIPEFNCPKGCHTYGKSPITCDKWQCGIMSAVYHIDRILFGNPDAR